MSKFFQQDSEQQWFPQQEKKQVLLEYLLSQEPKSKKLYKIKRKYVSYIKQEQESYVYLEQNMHCSYNKYEQSEYICIHPNCQRLAFICSSQSCKCNVDHRKCTITRIAKFLDIFYNKLSQPLPDKLYQYLQAKFYLFQFMMNTLSQQRQVIKEWYQNLGNTKKNLFVFTEYQGCFEINKAMCNQPKFIYSYPKLLKGHKQCGCIKNTIKQKRVQGIEQKFKQIMKIYNLLIQDLDDQIQLIEQAKQSANLNAAESCLLKYLKKQELQIQSTESHFGKKQNKITVSEASGFLFKKILQFRNVKKIDLKVRVQTVRQQWVRRVKQYYYKLTCLTKTKIVQILNFQQKQSKQVIPVQYLRRKIWLISQSFRQNENYLSLKVLPMKKYSKQPLLKRLFQFFNQHLIETKAIRIYEQFNSQFKYIVYQACQPKLNNQQKYVNSLEQFSSNFQIIIMRWQDFHPIEAQIFINVKMKNNKITYMKITRQFRKIKMEKFICDLCVKFPHLKKFKMPNQKIQRQQTIELANLKRLRSIKIKKCGKNLHFQIILDKIKLHKLEQLCIWADNQQQGKLTQKSLQRLCECSQLIWLTLQNIKQIPELHCFFGKLANLRILYLHSCQLITDETIKIIQERCPILTQLQIVRNINIKGTNIWRMVNLRKLTLFGCTQIDRQTCMKGIHRLTRLKLINFSQSANLASDNLLKVIANHCKRLQSLKIQKTDVTYQGIRSLKSLRQLTNLQVTFSENLRKEQIINLKKFCTKLQFNRNIQ